MKLLGLLIRYYAGLLIVLCVLAPLSIVAGQNAPYMGEMAFIATPHGFSELYLMDVQRDFRQRLPTNFVNDCCLTWSPDGARLTFVRDMSLDGSTDIFSTDFRTPIQRLTMERGADLYPTYSPDGTRIAYLSYGYDTNPHINLMNADGSQRQTLTTHTLIVNINPYPVWGADGKSILFSNFNDSHALLSLPLNCSDPCDDALKSSYPTSAPLLMKTAFIPLDESRLVMAAFDRSQKGGYGIYTLDTQQSDQAVKLTVNAGLAAPAMALYGHWLAFVSGTTDLQQKTDDTNLFVMDTNCIGTVEGCASTLRVIATQVRAEDNLSWSPDGRWLAFVSVANNQSHLNLMDTTCIFEDLDCAAYTRSLGIASSRYIRPAWRPVIG